MDTSTIRALIALNNQFYAQHAASFTATRSAPWHGWNALADLLRKRSRSVSAPENGQGLEAAACAVLDLACGNLRFEEFLTREFPHARFSFNAVDACPALASPQSLAQANIRYREVDILQHALAGLRSIDGAPACDLTVCFGFMHHVPSRELRRAVLDTLCAHTAPNGIVAVSFWQFMHDERLARKAMQAGALTADAPSPFSTLGIDVSQLDEHDHFLGWQTDPSPLRYCHHFPEAEIDELVASVGTAAHEVARYSADGTSGTLNRYLVLEKL